MKFTQDRRELDARDGAKSVFLRALVAVCMLAACSPAQAPTTSPEVADAGDVSGMPSGPRAVDRAIPDQDFRITITDDAAARHFNLTLTSLNAERELCVGAAEWPDARGRLEGAADFVSLQSNGQGFAMRDSGEQCGEACVRRIAPGATLEGTIGYDQFAPEAFDNAEHTLDFGAQPYFCDSGEVE
jgi:hypothetical protein